MEGKRERNIHSHPISHAPLCKLSNQKHLDFFFYVQHTVGLSTCVEQKRPKLSIHVLFDS